MKKNFLGRALLPLLLCGACDSQVGSEYEGEVLLTLSGDVVLQNEDQEDLKPALLFRTDQGQAIVPGHVEGVFPSDFTLQVTQRPPQQALRDGFALGYLALVEPGTQPRLDLRGEFLPFACQDYDGSEPCQFERDFCTPDDTCVSQSYTCETIDCEPVHSDGDPAVIDEVYGETLDEDAVHFDEADCHSGYCVTELGVCDDDLGCYWQVEICEYSEQGGREIAISDQHFHECRITQSNEDQSLSGWRPVETAATNYLVLFVGEDADREELEERGLGEAAPGYHLIQREGRTLEERIASAKCRLRAEGDNERAQCPGESLVLVDDLDSAEIELEIGSPDPDDLY